MMYQSTRLLAFSYVPGSAPLEVVLRLRLTVHLTTYRGSLYSLPETSPSARGLALASARDALLRTRNNVFRSWMNDS